MTHGLHAFRGVAQVIAHAMVELVVLDVRLPGEDALRIARGLREQSDVPIIMLSAHADEADRVMALEMGADDYLTIPERLQRSRRSSARSVARATSSRPQCRPSGR
jgi:DNA-binding response OmpR family regulator